MVKDQFDNFVSNTNLSILNFKKDYLSIISFLEKSIRYNNKSIINYYKNGILPDMKELSLGKHSCICDNYFSYICKSDFPFYSKNIKIKYKNCLFVVSEDETKISLNFYDCYYYLFKLYPFNIFDFDMKIIDILLYLIKSEKNESFLSKINIFR